MKKNYRVSFTIVSTHSYRVDECNSPEEAESIAEGLWADGDEGKITEQDIESTETMEEDESQDSE